MKGEQHLTKPQDFALVHGQGKWIGGGLLGIKSRQTGLPLARCGFVVSKRVGGAVIRNRIKRRLREIVRVLPLKPGADIVISARPRAAAAEFGELKTTVSNLLAQAGLLTTIDDKKDCTRGH
jgi:ribonuclease P protein component